MITAAAPDVGMLRTLSRSVFTGVSVRLEMTLSLERRFFNSVHDGIAEVLSAKLMQLDPRFDHYNLCPPS